MYNEPAFAVHQIRQIGPVQNKLFIIQVVGQNIPDPGQLQGYIGLRTDRQPDIRLGRIRRKAGIDHNCFDTLLPQFIDHASAGSRAGIGRIRSPQDQRLDRAVFFIEEFEAVKNVITDPVVLKRAKHAVYENQRTIEAVAALKVGDLVRFGKLMNESHVSLRDDYETSCEEADILAEEAWKMPGVLGSRITGGGFGGCTVSIVREETVPEFIEKIGAIYLEKVGHDADFYELEISGGPRELVP